MSKLAKINKWFFENHYLVQGFIWIGLVPPTLIWWQDSVLWVALMSLYANIANAFGANAAKKAEKETREANGD